MFEIEGKEEAFFTSATGACQADETKRNERKTMPRKKQGEDDILATLRRPYRNPSVYPPTYCRTGTK